MSSIIGCRTEDSDLQRSGELQLSPSSHHRRQLSNPRLCSQIFCRGVKNRVEYDACVRRNCRLFSAAAAEAGLPLDDGSRMRLLLSLRRPCPGPFCVGEDPEEEYHDDEDEISTAIQTEPSSLDGATWRAAAERRKTTPCVSICRQLADEVFYGSCIRHLCRSSISSAPEDGTKASSYDPEETVHHQPMTRQADAEMEHPSIWKRYGMRICAEAFCKSHYGYELVACGISHCHGK